MIHDVPTGLVFCWHETSLHEADATLKETRASASTDVGSMEAVLAIFVRSIEIWVMGMDGDYGGTDVKKWEDLLTKWLKQ